ncbi:c-type cytochrome [Mucilaginibacter psychrotolerans]|uniref:C-type cytochrome n=1 Tax=Mucilaginibacter psychrotolerans TaxID=1524096 RepID=A0A4Y8S6Q7_9SPHI|nr:c-type cytochrome [Mucilaginibacter psychrotolerans]TFF34137.1 c-type cytochrome [Mucilaginibacter psychrotolerans]
MKKVFIVLGISLVIAACGGTKPGEAEGGDTSTTATNQAATAATTNADTAASKTGTTAAPASKGATLIAGSDCTTCHKEHQKIIGPAFADIAKKYTAADTEKLAKKVIAGGSGNWGDVAMTAHPALSLDDAKEMVTYILSVK